MPSIIWEELGFTYVGPLDGHDIGALMDVFQRVKSLDKPVLVHVLTTKGKGYGPAEADAVALHGVSPRANGKPPAQTSTYTEAFADALVAIGRRDPRVVAITAAMPVRAPGAAKFAAEFPRRAFDVGIAEGHAVTLSGALARYRGRGRSSPSTARSCSGPTIRSCTTSASRTSPWCSCSTALDWWATMGVLTTEYSISLTCARCPT